MELINLCKTKKLKYEDVEQEKAKHSHTLIITKWIREYSKLDIQLSYTQEKYYAIEPTTYQFDSHIPNTFTLLASCQAP